MGPMGILKNIGRAITDTGKETLRKREQRGRSIRFQVEIARENEEFKRILNDLGKNTFEAGVGIILKTPTALFLNALKTIYNKKYNHSKYLEDAFKLFFGKDGVAHRTVKVVANALHLAGQGVKIGVRQLFKI
ncbi:MAG: hypothetical protein WC898_02680 [Candidatus Paceibacterota bacterium]|jgi:hypothetical protein